VSSDSSPMQNNKQQLVFSPGVVASGIARDGGCRTVVSGSGGIFLVEAEAANRGKEEERKEKKEKKKKTTTKKTGGATKSPRTGGGGEGGSRDGESQTIHGDASGESEYSLENGVSSWKEGKDAWKEQRENGTIKSGAGTKKGTGRDEERALGRKRKRREIETAVPWTEEMVRFLFETYDDVHRRLWIESRGKVKNQKKWDPIIKTMQEKFARDFTKNQCESKYWKVRRECTKYKLKLEKRAQLQPDLYAGKTARGLLKPKFYDVWLEVAGNSAAPMPEIDLSLGSPGETSPDRAYRTPGGFDEEAEAMMMEENEDMLLARHRHSSSCAIVREMQQVISVQLEASEKREEALNIRAELTMELLRQHMDRMERTGFTVEDARKRQLQMIEGVDNKLDRLVHGLSALNGNIGAIINRLASSNSR
jgi:hypothetical protein